MIIQRGPVLSGGLSTLCFSFQEASGGPREALEKRSTEDKTTCDTQRNVGTSSTLTLSADVIFTLWRLRRLRCPLTTATHILNHYYYYHRQKHNVDFRAHVCPPT